MGKDPAFMLYSQDFLVGVSDLTMEERGQYITMLCLQHQKGHLTKKNIQIAVGNVSEDVMNKFVQDENEMYYNETLETLIHKREAYSQSRSENGKKGGRPKKEPLKNQEKTICLPYAKAYENHSENENINENIIKHRVDYNSFIDTYNTLCFNLPSIYKLTDKRKKAISAFLKQMTLEEFENACERANNTPFLIGKNDRGWKADFDFIIKPDNTAKIIEGKYHSEEPKNDTERFYEELQKFREGVI